MPPRGSLAVVYAFQLVTNTGMAIIFPTALSYSEQLGAGAAFSGVMVAVLPFACLLGNYPMQKLIEQVPLRTLFYVQTAGNVVANVLYACAGLTHSKWTLLVARLLMGLCGQNTPVLVYISRSVGLNHRSWAMMVQSSTMGLGYVLGPLFAFVTSVFCKELRIDNLIVDQNTLPGWLMALLWFVLLVSQPFLFEEPREGGGIEGQTLVARRPPQEERPRVRAILLLLFLQVVGGMVFSLWEVFAALHCTRSWGWSDGTAGLYMACVMGSLLLICVLCSLLVVGKFADRSVLVCCCTAAACAAPFLFDYGTPRVASVVLFTVGSFALLSFCQLFRGACYALGSKVTPNSMQAQMSTWMSMANNFGRGIGPLVGSHAQIQVFAAVNVCVMGAAVAGTMATFGHLKPHAKAT